MTPKRKLEALRKLKKNDGWSVIHEVMEQELVALAKKVGQSPSMPMDQIRFSQGALWAAERLLDLPDRLITKLENDERLTPPTKDD